MIVPIILGLVTIVAVERTAKFVKKNKSKLTSEERNYISAMYVLRDKDSHLKIDIQKAQQFIDNYTLK